MAQVDFDFDAWMWLAKTSPDLFEIRRRECIENVIASCRDLRRVRGLQSRIELERLRAQTPLQSCLRLSTIMWDAFFEYKEKLNAYAYGTESSAIFFNEPTNSAKIYVFKSKKRRKARLKP